jgi:hypothetical protein
MTIEEIYYSEDISVRSFNVCNDNDLKDLNAILKHYREHKTFGNLRDCGRKSNEELIRLCLTYSNEDDLSANEIVMTENLFSKIVMNLSNKQTEEINYSTINQSKNLSVRSLNSLRFYLRGNLDIININEKILSNGDFYIQKLRNVGKKSIPEIIQFIESLKKELFRNTDLNFTNEKTPKHQNPIITFISNLTRIQREIVNSFIEINSNNLSNRSKNALTSFLDGNLKIRNISERILTNDRFNFQDIKNVGKKTVTELKSFFDSIIDFIAKVSEVENENELIALRNRFIIEKTFSISSIPDEILKSQSIFTLVDFLISKNVIFDKNENIIFLRAFKIYNNLTPLTLDEIAEELKISRERVRQIRKAILRNLFSNLQFLRNLDDDLYRKYSLDQNQQLINVDEILNKMINQINNTNFSTEFNSILIYSYIPDKYELLGNIEDVFQPKIFNSRGRHNWDNFYLVSQDLTNIFDFNKFVDDLSKRLNDRIEETYSFHFKSYLSNFLKVEDRSITALVLPVAEKIINKEFNLIIDLNDNIVFKRNTVKQVPEFAIEALEKLGAPANIEEIYKLIEKDFPEITKSKEALRGSLQQTPEIIYFGRSSTYGLKKWETEKDGIKGGTIKDIIFDYLNDKNYPIHILELVNEVHRYRGETNAKNIITNLKLDPQNQFLIFNQSFIGLSCKSYNSKLSNLPKFLGKSITHFIKLNNRINRFYVEEYFSKQLGISLENMNYIVEHLIDNNFIKIDNQNYLTV